MKSCPLLNIWKIILIKPCTPAGRKKAGVDGTKKEEVDGMILNSEITCKMDIYEGEQNSKYFCNLKKKRHFVQKAMCFIQKDDGDIIHDSNLITHEVKTFYENLYASHENNIIHRNTDNIKTPTLSQEESDKKHCHLLSK